MGVTNKHNKRLNDKEQPTHTRKSALPVRHTSFCLLCPLAVPGSGVMTEPCCLQQVQQASSVGTASSNLHTDSQPSYSTDSAHAAAAPALVQIAQQAKQPALHEATSPANATGTVPLLAMSPSADHDSSSSKHGPHAHSGKTTAEARASVASTAPASLTAGSPTLPVMTTRKRRRETEEPEADAPTVTAQPQDSAGAVSAVQPQQRVAEASAVPANPIPDNAVRVKQQPFGSLDLIDQVAIPEVVKLADNQNIVWCRVKGFPAWPVSAALTCTDYVYLLL